MGAGDCGVGSMCFEGWNGRGRAGDDLLIGGGRGVRRDSRGGYIFDQSLSERFHIFGHRSMAIINFTIVKFIYYHSCGAEVYVGEYAYYLEHASASVTPPATGTPDF